MQVHPFAPEFEDQVVELIVGIQRGEFGLDIGRRQAALRKMFVHPDHRGRAGGAASALLETFYHLRLD